MKYILTSKPSIVALVVLAKLPLGNYERFE
jgi:hypothetical protein